MNAFLNKVTTNVLSNHDNITHLKFILPNKRAGIFLKAEICNQLQCSSILPEINSIEEFIQEISGLDSIAKTALVFEFYSVYLICTKSKADSFDVFSKWATVLLQDFNEIDSNLINAEEILSYITDSKRIENWNLKNKNSSLTENYLNFIESIKVYYKELYQHLTSKNVGYQGMMYRKANDRLDIYLKKHTDKKFIFIGFNALNMAEDLIFQKILNAGSSKIYWDADVFYFQQKNEAGKFFRHYRENWKYYKSHEFNWISKNLNTTKQIFIKGFPKNITQIKKVGEILKNIQLTEKDLLKTAVILCNEKLLPVILNSIPKEIQNANITMGYSLLNIPLSNFFSSIFKLHINKSKYEKYNAFYYKDFLAVLHHPVLHRILMNNNEFQNNLNNLIIKNKKVFITNADIKSLIKNELVLKEIFTLIFLNWNENVDSILHRFIAIIQFLKVEESLNPLENEYLYRFSNVFQELINLNNEFGYLKDINTLYIFYVQLLNNERLFFQGEPLNGLQIMGMLESRVLDFENVILTSANEGFLPSLSGQSSFIPFDIKIEKKLPTYKEKDAIFAYHFYRLLHRAKNIYILFNTETDDFGSGEMSRFINQLEVAHKYNSLENIILNKSNVIPKFSSNSIPLKKISKSTIVINQLNELASEGFSSSSLCEYIRNPIDFYKHKVLKLKEVEEVEETIAANTFGTIIHSALYKLYHPYIGKYIIQDDLIKMKSNVDSEVKTQFQSHYASSLIFTGKNYLTFQIAKQFITNFLNFELGELKNNKKIKIINLELPVSFDYKLVDLPLTVKLKGIIDRIDEVDGVLRIVDYKTGTVNSSSLKINNWDLLSTEYEYNKSFQVLLYAFLYSKNNNINIQDQCIESGIISFKNLKSGFMKINNSNLTQKDLDQFLIQLNKLLVEIYNYAIPFKEKII